MTAHEIWKIRPIAWAAVSENELSERYYRMLLRWIPFASGHFHEWYGRPNCGYFFSGCFPYGTDTSYIVAIFAVLAKIGSYDPNVAQVPRQHVMEMAIKGIRYLGFTHQTGPSDCVRVEGKLADYSSKKWGRNDEGYDRETTTGRSIAALCLGARFLWDELDGETKELVQNVASSYADRWSQEKPRSGSYNDTQEEENAWTAMGISAAMDLFPEHPHSPKWQQGFIRWSAGSITTFRDAYIHEPVHCAQTPRTQGAAMFPVRAITLHPDYSTENHGFVHPNYMVAGIYLRGMHVVSALAGGCDIISSALYNNEEIYDRAIKQFSQKDGFLIPVQGQDWWYNSQHGNLLTHAFLNVAHLHRQAARLERNALQQVERLQNSNANGCFLEENGERCMLNPAWPQTAQDAERLVGFNLLLAYLLHAFGGEGADPAREDELWQRLAGVYYYPYGSFILHRTNNTLSSFSWRNSVMAVTMPDKGIWTFTPLFTNYTGIVQFNESKGIRGLSNEQRVRDVDRCHIQPERDGFGTTAVIARGDRELLQDIAFIALPDGRTVYAEQFRAMKNCSVSAIQTGMIGIRNERYAALPELAPGEKTIHLPSVRETFKGFYGDAADEIKAYPPVPYLNVNDEMGFVLIGSHGVKYWNRHQYPKWKGVEDVLTLNDIGSRHFRCGDTLPPFVVLSAPNRTAAETALLADRTCCLDCDAGRTIMMETEGYLVYARFEDDDRLVNVRKSADGLPIVLFEGLNRIEGDHCVWSGKLPGFRSGYLRGRYSIELEPAAGISLDFNLLADRLVIVNRSMLLAAFQLTQLETGRLHTIEVPALGYYIYCEVAQL